MSIVRMQKLSVIGLNSVKEDLIKELMRLGVVEITAQEAKLQQEEWKELVEADENQASQARLDSRIAQAAQAIAALEKYDTAKKPLFHLKRSIKRDEFLQVTDSVGEIQEQIDEVNSYMDQITELKKEQNKAEITRISLLPWQEYPVSLEIFETDSCYITRGTLPAAANAEKLKEALAEATECCELDLVGQDAEQQYVCLLYLKEETAAIEETLRQFGFNRSQLGVFTGTAAEVIRQYEANIASMEKQIQQLEEKIQSRMEYKELIETLYDSWVLKRDQAAVRSSLLVTDSTFYLEGWTPKAVSGHVEELLTKMECWYELADPEKDEETPVLMQNGGFSAPFEAVTKLYALPDSRGIDPTPFFSFFYALFFGMMLSDAAYGAIITAATFIFLKKYPVGGMMGQLMKMFFYCGISTMFWGVLFGGYFGDIVTVVAKTFFHADVVIPPVWFNPLEEPMTMLVFSFILGGIHLFLGMGINAYMSIRDGRPMDALCDVGLWYLLLIGLVLGLGGSMAGFVSPAVQKIGMWMSIIGAGGILLTGGRHKKGLGKITGGFGSLYNITSYLADVLSYSRLLALGLATGVIASVINTLGSLAGGGVGGAILLTVVFVIGHAYNLSINALGSFVHSSRLQYVEFFGKFYESGGEEFKPFCENTKYVDILKEEE